MVVLVLDIRGICYYKITMADNETMNTVHYLRPFEAVIDRWHAGYSMIALGLTAVPQLLLKLSKGLFNVGFNSPLLFFV